MQSIYPDGKKRGVSMEQKRILIVEDEILTAQHLAMVVEEAGYKVVCICDRGECAIREALRLKPDLIFMDIMLKDNISGSEAALKITTLIDTKIIFLTAYSDDEMIEYAIDSKAVNYIIKPFSQEQIITALKLAFMLPSEENRLPSDTVLLPNGYSFNLKTKNLLKNTGESVPLRGKKRELLHALIKNIDSVVPYKQLIEILYGQESSISALRTQISRLNKALGFTLIENVNGIGYKISSPNKKS